MEELRRLNAEKYRAYIICNEILPRMGKLICLDPIKRSAFRISSFIKRKKYFEKSLFPGIETYRHENGKIISLENIDESIQLSERLIDNLDRYRNTIKMQSIEFSRVLVHDGNENINKKIYTKYLLHFIKDKIEFNEELYTDIFMNFWEENLHDTFFKVYHQNLLSASFNPKEPHDLNGLSIFEVQKMIIIYMNLNIFLPKASNYSWINNNLNLNNILSKLKHDIITNIQNFVLKLQVNKFTANLEEEDEKVFCSYCFDVISIKNIVPIENSSDDIKICVKCHSNFFREDPIYENPSDQSDND